MAALDQRTGDPFRAWICPSPADSSAARRILTDRSVSFRRRRCVHGRMVAVGASTGAGLARVLTHRQGRLAGRSPAAAAPELPGER
jgi:hypothetical protein